MVSAARRRTETKGTNMDEAVRLQKLAEDTFDVALDDTNGWSFELRLEAAAACARLRDRAHALAFGAAWSE